MTIIEADGINTDPVTVDSIQIHAGQRYSFILHANGKEGNYWVRAEPRQGFDGGPGGFEGGINSAILRYAGSPKIDPKSLQQKSVMPLVESNLHPLENPGAPGRPHAGGADVHLNLELGISGGRLEINNVTFKPPTVPVLLQILSGKRKASDLLPHGSVYTLPPNKVIEISILPGTAPGGPVSSLP